MKNRYNILILLSLIIIFGCQLTPEKLPILGNRTTQTHVENGKEVVDTIYQSIPDFSFVDQDGNTITNAFVKGRIYIADFFFISCPTICPVMKKQMLKIYQAYKGDPSVLFLSHTIDPDHDTLALLKDYCTRLGSDGKQWKFLRGEREYTYNLAENGYYASARVDSTEPGGFIHSGGFILVDPQLRVRGIYDGTSEEDAARLIADIARLKTEK